MFGFGIVIEQSGLRRTASTQHELLIDVWDDDAFFDGLIYSGVRQSLGSVAGFGINGKS
jgi:hypothetical protein